jgi:flagellar secretion chaperone FliS
MTATPRSSPLAAYHMVATHGGVAAADAHGLILMLLDGALSRIAQARGCAERGRGGERVAHLNRTLGIIGELRASLVLGSSPIADNLESLYEYMARQILQAHVDTRPELLDRVSALLQEIRSAWAAIPAEQRARVQAGR